MAVFNLKDENDGLKELYDRIMRLPREGEAIITSTLHNEGAQCIKNEIDRLLPRSGRKWKGKKKPATSNKKAIMPREDESTNLNVVVGTTYNYHYLYFPDDGSNTKNHMGNQHFMIRGAENSADKVVDLCIRNLMKEIND